MTNERFEQFKLTLSLLKDAADDYKAMSKMERGGGNFAESIVYYKAYASVKKTIIDVQKDMWESATEEQRDIIIEEDLY